MTTFLVAAILLGLGVLGMCAAIILKKDGRFPQFDVGSNEQMHRMGIRCFKDEDAALHSRKCSGNYSEACRDCKLFEKK